MIECKRPVSEDAVPRNVLKAKQQLKRSCQAADTVRRIGIIALDVTKFTNPAFSVLTRIPPQQAAPVLSGHLEDFGGNTINYGGSSKGAKLSECCFGSA